MFHPARGSWRRWNDPCSLRGCLSGLHICRPLPQVRFPALYFRLSTDQSPSSCRCGNDATAVRPVNESFCEYHCMGDESMGKCGTQCPENDTGTSTVLQAPSDSGSQSASGGGALSPPADPPAVPQHQALHQSSAVSTVSHLSSTTRNSAFVADPVATPQTTTADLNATSASATMKSSFASEAGAVTAGPSPLASDRSQGSNLVPSRAPGSNSQPIVVPDYRMLVGLVVVAFVFA